MQIYVFKGDKFTSCELIPFVVVGKTIYLISETEGIVSHPAGFLKNKSFLYSIVIL